MTILHTERNLLKLYMYAAGKSEIPPQWHLWCCLTMIAAMVSNRVFYQVLPWQQLNPNLYSFLIGPSGLGKGAAINFALQFYNPAVHMRVGITTDKHLIDIMSSPSDAYPDPQNLLLIQPELGDSVRKGPLADAYIKFMTECYTPSTHGLEEGTRTHGEKSMPPPCINWICGTTTEWLSDCVDEKAMMSGFFGRVAGALGEYEWNNRVHDPAKFTPDDYQEVIGHIYSRMDDMLSLSGGFDIEADAYDYDEYWYMNRPIPSAGLEAFWKREHDLVLKLGMVFSLCDSIDMVIKLKHIEQAQDLVDDVRLSMPRIVRMSTSTRAMANSSRVHRYFVDKGTKIQIGFKELVKYSNHWNIRIPELNAILYELQMLDAIGIAPRGKDNLDAFYYLGGDRNGRGTEEWEKASG